MFLLTTSLLTQEVTSKPQDEPVLTDFFEDYELCKKDSNFGKNKFVCDPDHSLRSDTVGKLEALLLELQDSLKCPCTVGCPVRGLANKNSYLGLLQVTTNGKIQKTGKTIEEAAKHMYANQEIGAGECDNGVVIFYTRDTNQLSTYSGDNKFVVLQPNDLTKLHEFAQKGIPAENNEALQIIIQSLKEPTYRRANEIEKSELSPSVIGLLIALLVFFIVLAFLLACCCGRFCCCFTQKHKERKGEYVVNHENSSTSIMKGPEPFYVVPHSEYGMSPHHEDAIYSTPYSVPLYSMSRPTTPSSVHLNKIRSLNLAPEPTMSQFTSPLGSGKHGDFMLPHHVNLPNSSTTSDTSSHSIELNHPDHSPSTHDSTYQFLDPRRFTETQTKEEFIE
uniref:CX domain-containing protein n=1 Tax=Rhabditophanes sp. KR3021 TaxID=114890 RepID=A0AC35UCC5_9BILA